MLLITTDKKYSLDIFDHPRTTTRTWETELQGYLSGSSTCLMSVDLNECVGTKKLLSAAQIQLDSFMNMADSVIRINVDCNNDALIHDTLKLLKSLKFGHRCQVPKIKIYIPFNRINLNVLNIIERHNNIDKYISITVILNVNDNNLDMESVLYTCDNYLQEHCVTHNYMIVFTPSCAIERIMSLQRKVLSATNGNMSVYLNGNMWTLSSLVRFLSFDGNACFNYGIDTVPFLPPGAMDVIYCAKKLRNFEEASNPSFNRLDWQDIISCCYMLRSNNFRYETNKGAFMPVNPTYKRFHWLAQIIANKPRLLPRVMIPATSLYGVKEHMAELTA